MQKNEIKEHLEKFDKDELEKLLNQIDKGLKVVTFKEATQDISDPPSFYLTKTEQEEISTAQKAMKILRGFLVD